MRNLIDPEPPKVFEQIGLALSLRSDALDDRTDRAPRIELSDHPRRGVDGICVPRWSTKHHAHASSANGGDHLPLGAALNVLATARCNPQQP